MRYLLALATVLAGTITSWADGPGLREARREWLRGNYAEAQAAFTTLAKNPQHRAAATLGQSRALESQGAYDQALAIIDTVLQDRPQNPDLQARRAELLYLLGRWEEAEKSAAAALALNDEQFLARWIRGQIYRDRGEVKKADDEFRWFVRIYSQRSQNDKDITDPDALILVGLAGCERARWHRLADQFQFILDEVYGETLKQDKDYWWGEYHRGRLLLEKYNRAGAARSLDKALAINPRAAEVLVLKGVAALQRFEIKDAESHAEQALKINPRLTEGLRLRADLHLFAGNIGAARETLARARAVNPREETTLARIAACLHLQGQDAALAEVVKEVEKHNAKPGVFYQELADRLEERKLFPEAEKFFRRAIELRQELPWALNNLGLLYMRLGKEEEARQILDKAFEADSFNVRVSNTLKVLDHLAKYSTLKTTHFLVRYDAKNDQVLANFMGKYLEDIYTELADKFQYRPAGPILVEIFNKHEMFSGRVTALPDLHTIGACTGPLIAMVSPRDKSRIIAKPFNWNRVLRHELVHVFNLEQTRYRVPHWFTEGLAVSSEGGPMPPRWNYLLAEKLQAGELLNLDNILLGFIRPTSPEQWHQAYMQSLLYVDYLTQTHGPKAVADLLAAYRDGLETAAALKKVCGVSQADFENGYRIFLEERAKKVTLQSATKALTFKQLKEAHLKDPTDADVAGQLAEKYLLIGDKKQARKLADEVLERKPTQPQAALVKARLLSDGGEPDRALSLLASALDPQQPDLKLARLLGKLQLESKKLAEAAKTFELGRRVEPYDNYWLQQLARIHVQSGDDASLIAVLEALAPTDADDLPTRRKLAQLLLKAGKHAEAEKYARQALEIDVLDAEAHLVMLQALKEQKKEDDLNAWRKLLGQ